MEVSEDAKKGQAMKQMSNVKSLRELGIEFGMPNASKREIAMEVIRRARRLGVMTSELMKRKQKEVK